MSTKEQCIVEASLRVVSGVISILFHTAVVSGALCETRAASLQVTQLAAGHKLACNMGQQALKLK